MERVDQSDLPALASKPVVLFDFDGTVADTQTAIFRSVREVLSRRGYDLSDDQLRPLIGPPLEEGIRLVCDIDADGAREVAVEYRALFERTVTADEIPVFPGMRELLDALRSQGRRIAVATSRIESATKDLIAMLGVTQFHAIAGRVSGVRYSKTESISAALDLLDASPDQAVMIGDRKERPHSASPASGCIRGRPRTASWRGRGPWPFVGPSTRSPLCSAYRDKILRNVSIRSRSGSPGRRMRGDEHGI